MYAGLVGILCGLPHYWFWQDAGQDWAFPHLNVPDEGGAYAGRLRALYNGEDLVADSQTRMCPDAPSQFPKTGEYLTYGLARLFGLKIRGCLILADFLLPAISVIGFYLFLRALGCSARVSRVGPLTLYLLDPTLTAGGPLVTVKWLVALILGRDFIPYWHSSYAYSRLISPETALPLLAFACFATAKVIWGGRGWVWPVVAGLLAGLTTSAHLACGLPLLFALFFFGSAMLFIDRELFGRIVLLEVIASIVLVPRLLEVLLFFNLPGNHFVVDRQAVITHAPMSLSHIAFIGMLIVPFLLFFWKKRDRVFGFFLSIIAGNLVCMNLQIFSGSDFSILHYVAYSFLPMIYLSYFVGVSRRLQKSPDTGLPRRSFLRARVLEVLCCVYAVTTAVLIQHGNYHADKSEYGWVAPASRWLEYQSLGPVLSWLDDNATNRDVVLSSPETTDLYAIYSPAKVLAQFMIQTCPVPTEAYIDRFIVPFKVYGLDWAGVETRAEEMAYDIHFMSVSWNVGPSYLSPERPPLLQKPEVISLMKRHYETLPRGTALDRMLRELRVKYVICGSFEKDLPGATCEHLNNGNYEKRFEAKGHQVFELILP